jgi:hypothetical protein
MSIGLDESNLAPCGAEQYLQFLLWRTTQRCSAANALNRMNLAYLYKRLWIRVLLRTSGNIDTCRMRGWTSSGSSSTPYHGDGSKCQISQGTWLLSNRFPIVTPYRARSSARSRCSIHYAVYASESRSSTSGARFLHLRSHCSKG